MFTMAFQSRALLDPELRELEKFLEADNEVSFFFEFWIFAIVPYWLN